MDFVIDDRDPRASYSQENQWQTGGVPSEFNSTVTFTTVSGATATITFSHAFFVYVYGTIGPSGNGSPPESMYAIDGGTPTVFTATPQTDVQYRQRFFSSSILSPGTHTLVITVLNDNAFYYFDYIQMFPDPLPWPLQETTPTISTNSITPMGTSFETSTTLSIMPPLSNTSSVSTVTSLSTPNVSSQSRMTTRFLSGLTAEPSSMTSSVQRSQASASSSHVSPALITGVVIGGLGLTLVFFFVVYRLKSQLSKRAAMSIYGSSWTTNLPDRTSVVVPYLLSTMNPSPRSGKHDDRRQPQPEMSFKKTRGTI